MERYHIGIDSTDSATLGMCTTYLGARLLELLARNGFEVDGPPELVRLNPNVPWKTRGNGAVHLQCSASRHRKAELFALARELTGELAVLEDPQTNPGLAIVEGTPPDGLGGLYNRALHSIVELEEAIAVGEVAAALMHGWKNRRGLIGALASIGADLEIGHTWEVIAYRREERYRSKRDVDPVSLKEASKRHPSTFFNIDDAGMPVCVPHSPCPVLFGIRGTDPHEALEAASEVRSEEIERWVLWRTNQHTDAHIEPIGGVAEARPYRSVLLEGSVSSTPAYRQGGHLYFTLRDSGGFEIVCAAYRQTRSFRERLSKLAPGDAISVWGAVRPSDGEHPVAINLEKVRLDACTSVYSLSNPLCPRCGARMESTGRGQGKRCKRCRLRVRHAQKDRLAIDRDLSPGFIEPHPEAWRHLYRPCRMPPPSAAIFTGSAFGLGRPRL